jgi:peptidoglycan/xylan/chitin deacetylase (PgdA/CDA1 family)
MYSLRIDRALSLAIAGAFDRSPADALRSAAPVLMYHTIRRQPDSGGPIRGLNTTPEVFAAQMALLAKSGYRSIPLAQAMNALAANLPMERCVVITFDDGYRDFYTEALPILSRHGLAATVFAMPDFIGGQRGDRDAYMDWSELREAQAWGTEIGSHSMSHHPLWHLSQEHLQEEIGRSREVLEQHLGSAVNTFSYPYAFPEQDRAVRVPLRRVLAANGYVAAVTTIIGTATAATDRYLMPRIPINTHDDPQLFRAKLSGAYDWMHRFQLLGKQCRSLISGPRQASAS